MNKVFLSHSSKDKTHYIRTVAEKLGKENIEYDEWTFEEGELTVQEIESRLDSCEIFAFFISNTALESPWVIGEINRAYEMLTREKIKKIYPIIIDENITYADSRIPDWLRENYNLKYISRPVVTARRIQSKLRENHWVSHPTKKLRHNIFVGRNQLVSDFESRIDDIDLPKPTCLFASGIQKIGRNSLLKYALVKSNLSKASYTPIKIHLERIDSIEDLIIKLFDTGLPSLKSDEITNMLNMSIDEKITLLNKVLHEIQDSKEIIFIEDSGCIVDYTRKISDWFLSSLNGLKEVPTLCITTQYRIDRTQLRNKNNIFAIEIPELTPAERSGLFKRLIELHEI